MEKSSPNCSNKSESTEDSDGLFKTGVVWLALLIYNLVGLSTFLAYGEKAGFGAVSALFIYTCLIGLFCLRYSSIWSLLLKAARDEKHKSKVRWYSLNSFLGSVLCLLYTLFL